MTASPFTPFERPGMLRRSSYDLFEAIEKSVFNEQESRYIFRQLGTSTLVCLGVASADDQSMLFGTCTTMVSTTET
jgi:hypothetical protein